MSHFDKLTKCSEKNCESVVPISEFIEADRKTFKSTPKSCLKKFGTPEYTKCYDKHISKSKWIELFFKKNECEAQKCSKELNDVNIAYPAVAKISAKYIKLYKKNQKKSKKNKQSKALFRKKERKKTKTRGKTNKK
jgi:hypothetical protein